LNSTVLFQQLSFLEKATVAAEVVGSTPTRSTFICEGTTALTTLVLGNRRTRLINKRQYMSMKGYL
jgi:hypothetical protein